MPSNRSKEIISSLALIKEKLIKSFFLASTFSNYN